MSNDFEKHAREILERVTFRMARQLEILEATNARAAANAEKLRELQDNMRSMNATLDRIEGNK